MKTIGILGGLTASSTETYQRELCSKTREFAGGRNSPEIIIRTLNFARIESLKKRGQWDEVARLFNLEAKKLEQTGADFIILTSTTMHQLADPIMKEISIPLLHIVDVTVAVLNFQKRRSPALIGTGDTMEGAFYIDRLIAAGISPIMPEQRDRDQIDRIIYEELCKGIVSQESRAILVAIAKRLVNQGADCLILGCTEVRVLLHQSDFSVPFIDTIALHCKAALEKAYE